MVTSPIGVWTELPGGVLTALSSVYVTRTVALPVGAERCVLVDPAVTPGEVRTLLAGLQQRALRVVAVLHTHAHWDHLLWPEWADPEMPRWASEQCIEEAMRNEAALHTQAARDIGEGGVHELLSSIDTIRPLPADGTVPDLPDLAVITHDAHSLGHIAVLHQASATLCAGDMLSDVELPLAYAEGASEWDVDGYLAGLAALEPFIRRATVVVPGHGHPGADVAARAHADRSYLAALQQGERTADPRLVDPPNRAVDAELRAHLAV